MWEMAARALPFEHIRFNYQIEDAVKSGQRPEIPLDVLPQMRLLIGACWAQDPATRPDINAVVLCLEAFPAENTTPAKIAEPSETQPLLSLNADEN